MDLNYGSHSNRKFSVFKASLEGATIDEIKLVARMKSSDTICRYLRNSPAIIGLMRSNGIEYEEYLDTFRGKVVESIRKI